MWHSPITGSPKHDTGPLAFGMASIKETKRAAQPVATL